MLRNARWKYHYYVRHEPELFDLENDPEETTNLAARADHCDIVQRMERELRAICDPEKIDRQAKADQAALIARHGGAQAAFDLGRAVAGGTPAPVSQPKAAPSGRSL
jgi:choline-sulfatase